MKLNYFTFFTFLNKRRKGKERGCVQTTSWAQVHNRGGESSSTCVSPTDPWDAVGLPCCVDPRPQVGP